MMIGFARVGNNGESLKAQQQKLRQEGCSQIFEEKDGKNFKGKALENALNTTNEGDVFIVTRLDKLACFTGDLAAITKRLQEKGAHLKVLDQRIDTTGSDLAFNIIASLAEFGNDVNPLTREAGFGRKPMLSERDEQEIIRLYREGSLPVGQLAAKYGVSPRTVYRIIKRSLGTAPESGDCNAIYQQQAVGRNHPRRIYSSYG